MRGVLDYTTINNLWRVWSFRKVVNTCLEPVEKTVVETCGELGIIQTMRLCDELTIAIALHCHADKTYQLV